MATNHPAYRNITSWQSCSPSPTLTPAPAPGCSHMPVLRVLMRHLAESHIISPISISASILRPQRQASCLSLASVCSHGLHREVSLSETLVLWCAGEKLEVRGEMTSQSFLGEERQMGWRGRPRLRSSLGV